MLSPRGLDTPSWTQKAFIAPFQGPTRLMNSLLQWSPTIRVVHDLYPFVQCTRGNSAASLTDILPFPFGDSTLNVLFFKKLIEAYAWLLTDRRQPRGMAFSGLVQSHRRSRPCGLCQFTAVGREAGLQRCPNDSNLLKRNRWICNTTCGNPSEGMASSSLAMMPEGQVRSQRLRGVISSTRTNRP